MATWLIWLLGALAYLVGAGVTFQLVIKDEEHLTEYESKSNFEDAVWFAIGWPLLALAGVVVGILALPALLGAWMTRKIRGR